ncbi:AAA family ATPase [Alphaproteobacteria bacterium]|nr:AAA family ATPase [Alphaproteobacteria bacterium]MDA8780237.1 AAA family ATPase [Alphaproteobacteria bacterium]
MTTNPEKKSPEGVQANRDSVTIDMESKSPAKVKAANDNGQEVIDTRSISPRPVTLPGLMAAEIPPRNFIVDPIIKQKDMVEVVAAAGVGKTTFLTSLVAAIASGRQAFGRWTVSEPQSVLVIDGEMTAEELRRKMAAALQQYGIEASEVHNIAYLSRDYGNIGFSDLSSPEARKQIVHQARDFDIVAIDNLSCLINQGSENEAESFRPVRNLLLDLKSDGKTSICLHHTGKNGDKPRGTSTREDSMDTVIRLRKSDFHSATDGASFLLDFYKTRSFFGDAGRELHFQYEEIDSIAHWTVEEAIDPRLAEVLELLQEGKKGTEIATALNISEGEVSKRKKKLIELGLFS